MASLVALNESFSSLMDNFVDLSGFCSSPDRAYPETTQLNSRCPTVHPRRDIVQLSCPIVHTMGSFVEFDVPSSSPFRLRQLLNAFLLITDVCCSLHD